MTVATSEAKPIPVEVVKPLKLSEAIRLGSMGTQQAVGEFVDPKGGMCVMSTAWYALTGHAEKDARKTPLFQMLGLAKVEHPVKGIPSTLQATLMDLNDAYRWPRHRVADWLEGLGL